LDTLENILSEAGLKSTNFVKMDIEGYETEVIQSCIETIKKANIVAIELHNSRSAIDSLLIPQGFTFEPLTTLYCIKKLLSNSLPSKPSIFFNIVSKAIARDPMILYKLLLGHEIINNKASSRLQTGIYVRKNRNVN
jgi:hypothetical protein